MRTYPARNIEDFDTLPHRIHTRRTRPHGRMEQAVKLTLRTHRTGR